MTFGGSIKYGNLFDSGDHGADNVGKCSYKMTVEICKSYECFDISNLYKSLPIPNSFNFLGVNANVFVNNDQSLWTNFGNVEFTFVDVCL